MIEAFSTPPTDRFFEDYKVGATYVCGSFTVTEDEIIDFASQYDPQMMHVIRSLAASARSARSSPAAGTPSRAPCGCSSTISCPITVSPPPASTNSAGPAPFAPATRSPCTRPSSRLGGHAPSPTAAWFTPCCEVLNQNGEVVMSMKPMNLVRVRNPAPQARITFTLW